MNRDFAPLIVDVLFAAVPDSPNLLFVEVETPDRRSVNVGEWWLRDDGYHALRLTLAPKEATDG